MSTPASPPGSFLHWLAGLCFVLAAIGLFVDFLNVPDGLALIAVGLALLAAPWRP